MKKLQTLLSVTVFCAAFMAISAQAYMQGFATVVRVMGSASYSLGNDEWVPLQAGKYLPVGATIRTGDNGFVDIILGKEVMMPQATWQPSHISYAPDPKIRGLINFKPSVEQNMVRLTPSTTLAIDKLTIVDTGADTVSDTELNLKTGKIYASVKKLTGASQYLIKIPNGIAGVRGTLFSISADGSISCFESSGGGVLLSLIGSGGAPVTHTVLPGQGFSPASGISTLAADAMKALKNIFSALRTTYLHVCDFSHDWTRCWVSPTQGNNGKHLGWSNGGGNGNGNGNGGSNGGT